MRSSEEMVEVRDLLSQDLSSRAVAERTGVPFGTVQRWRQRRTATFGAAVVPNRGPWRPDDPSIYAYLLGLDLGDGHVNLARTGGVHLEPWQRYIVDAHPDWFVRGLIHSDGCRTVNRFTTTLPSGRIAEYAYPRYFFTNLSSDIRQLFCDACDRLGVHWTQSSFRNISVADRRSVEILERVVGPKA